MIFQLIDSINGTSIEELRKMYLEMTDILDHNFNLVSEKLDRNKRMHHETYSDNKRV
jgi:hypothetical protein